MDPEKYHSDTVNTIQEYSNAIERRRTFAQLCTCFAILALLISCVGLYGTMAYDVVRHTGEIGLRMALGAKRGLVIWPILRDVLRLATAGVVIGLAAAWA